MGKRGKDEPMGDGSGNSRNGHSKKTVLTDDGSVSLDESTEEVR